MAQQIPIEILDNATEDDVAHALDGASVTPPLTDPTDLLEFFNRMVDVLTGRDAPEG